MNLDGYVPVNVRLMEALKRWPELRVVEAGHELVQLGADLVLICKVAVYRTPDDPLPAIGTASEHVPGKTPFTRGSELMVGYTSALGRALGYCGIGIDRGLATADEVKAAEMRRTVELRGPTEHRPTENRPPDRPRSTKAPTDAQMTLIARLAAERGIEAGFPGTFDEASAEIDRLKGYPRL
jgi:hypothetical protein